ncbi:MAG: AsmA-like C-terminal domain-containing protein [Thermodesulfobacteriota bacterium]
MDSVPATAKPFKIIRTVLLFLAVLPLLGVVLFFILIGRPGGLTLNRLELASAVISNATIRYHDGLNLEIEQLDIRPNPQSPPMTLERVKEILTATKRYQRYLPPLTIGQVNYRDYRATLKYQGNALSDPVELSISSENTHISASLAGHDDIIRMTLHELKSKKLATTVRGTIDLDPNSFQARGNVVTELAGCIPVKLDIVIDREEISFSGKGNGTVTTIKPFVDLFGLSHGIQRWITDYLWGSSYHLDSVSGSIPWDDPAAILSTLKAEVRVDDCQYTFAPGLEPIKTEYTDVSFKNGVLEIVPHQSTFYGQDGQTSRLDINFNDHDNITLTAYIKTTARANKDIIALVAYYGIPLPFLQQSGLTDVDLTLAINLNKVKLHAVGYFDIKTGDIEYEGKRYKVQSGRIGLVDSNISISDLEVGLDDFFQARVNGEVATKEKSGELDIEVHSVQIPLENKSLHLDQNRPPLRVQYRFRPQLTTLSALPSHWVLDDRHIHLGTFSAPFLFSKLSTSLPKTSLLIDDMARLTLKGEIGFKDQLAELELEFTELTTGMIHLADNTLKLNADYDDGLFLRTEAASQWLIGEQQFQVAPLAVALKNRHLHLEKCRISSPNLVDTSVKGAVDLSRGMGEFHLAELVFGNKKSAPFLQLDDQLALTIELAETHNLVTIEELGISISSEQEGGWAVRLDDATRLQKQSPLLQRLKIGEGELHLAQTSRGSPLHFQGSFTSAYNFFVRDRKPLADYFFSGSYSSDGLEVELNRDFHLHYKETVEIRSSGLGFNLPAIINFLQDNTSQEEAAKPTENGLRLTLKSEDSYLYLRPDNLILADSMVLNIKDGQQELHIFHDEGSITVTNFGNHFSLLGSRLGDTFINELVKGANFTGGKLTAIGQGSLKNFKALFLIEDTLLEDYVLINNILAVINTLPALITFSLPGYDTKGLPVDSAKLWLDYSGGLADVRSFELNSPELDLRGVGKVDIFKQQVDLDINLITQAGKNISKIPLVGYILAGDEERPSLSFEVSGDLLNPKVTSSAFEEIYTMPFSMIYRTLKTPVNWAEKLIEPLPASEVEADDEMETDDEYKSRQ